MAYEVIDNFLETKDFERLQSVFLSNGFPWYYNDYTLETQSSTPYVFQFTHIFYKDFNITSDYYHAILPLVQKVNPKALLRIKANLTTRSPERIVYGNHTDMLNASLVKTAVFYVNTNDGATVFSNGEEVKSVENRFVVFDCDTLHSGTSATDENIRCLINLNYYDRL